LDRDEVLHTLLFTAEKIGGEAGQRLLLGYADQAQAGQLHAPGDGTASFLFEIKRKYGTVGRRETALAEPAETVSKEELEKALAQAKGGLFSNRQKQIAGLAVLGRARDAETIPTILGSLHSRDPMVSGAAETALAQFLVPVPAPRDYERFLLELFGEPKLLRGEGLDRLLLLIGRSFPKRPPYDGLFQKYASQLIEDGALLHRLKGAIVIPETAAASGSADGTGASGDRSDAAPKAKGRVLTDLDRKREYLLKRQEWIRGGKRGPAPEPPE
jgi:hypothetical protein